MTKLSTSISRFYLAPDAEALEINAAALLCESPFDSSLEDLDLIGPEL